MTTKRKLDDLSETLSPADAVLNLVQPALQAESWIEYMMARIRVHGTRPDAMRETFDRLKEQVERAREKATEGMPKAERERLIRAAWPETRFLHDLVDYVNRQEVERMQQWGLVYFAINGVLEIDPTEHVGHVVEVIHALRHAAQFILGPHIREVLFRGRVLQVLSDRFFDGRPFVFQGALKQLEEQVESVDYFIWSFNELYSKFYSTTFFADLDEDEEVTWRAQAIVDQVRAQIFVGARDYDAAFKMLRRGEPEGWFEAFWPSG